MKQRVLVIGRGIIGLAVVHRLVKSGFRNVVLCGARNQDSFASNAAMGLSTVRGSRISRAPIFEAKLMGHARLGRWLKEISEDTSILIPFHFGTSEGFSSKAEFQKISKRIYHNEFRGLSNINLHSNEELSDKLGHRFPPDICGGFYYPDDIYFDVDALLNALDFFAKKSSFVENIEENVEKITPDEKGGFVVFTETKTIRTDEVILAAGPGSADILNKSKFSSIRMKGVLGHTLKSELGPCSESFAFMKGTHAVVSVANQLSVGSSSLKLSGLLPSPEELGSSQLLVEDIKKHLFESIDPEFVKVSKKSWNAKWGVRVISTDRLPIIGPIYFDQEAREGRILLATAMHKTGYQLANITASFLVSQLLQSEMCKDFRLFQSFAPSRF